MSNTGLVSRIYILTTQQEENTQLKKKRGRDSKDNLPQKMYKSTNGK